MVRAALPFRDHRLSARQRGYDARWERAARQFKAEHPLCLGCEAIGRVEPTSVVDHIIPHRGDKQLFWAPTNWQPACDWHHNAVKAILEHMYVAGTIKADDLRLDSSKAIAIAKQTPRKHAIGTDGWPT